MPIIRARDRQGFSMIEMLVTAAITSLVALFLGTTIISANKTGASEKDSASFQLLKSQINQKLFGGILQPTPAPIPNTPMGPPPTTCTKLLGDGYPNPVPSINAVVGGATPLVFYNYPGVGIWLQDPSTSTTSTPSYFDKLKINSLQFNALVPNLPTGDGPHSPFPNDSYVYGNITVSVTKGTGTTGNGTKDYGSANLTATLPLFLKLDSSNRVIGCSASNTEAIKPFPLPSCNPNGQSLVMVKNTTIGTYYWDCQ